MEQRNINRHAFAIKRLSLFVGTFCLIFSNSALSWCALNKSFSTTSSSQCAIDLYRDCDDLQCTNKTLPVCNNDYDLSLIGDLSDIRVRGGRFQPEGTSIINSTVTLHEAYSGLALLCFGSNDRVTYKWKIPTANSPQVISVAGKPAFNTNDSAGLPEIGMRIIASTDSGAPIEFPNQTESPAYVARVESNGTSNGVFLYDFGRLKVEGIRTLDTGALTQNKLTIKPYAELEVSYYSSEGATSPSTATFRVHIGENLPVAKINTCGVRSSQRQVNLGDASAQNVRAFKAPIVPFAINYDCDGAINQNAWVAFKPHFGTLIENNERTLIRERSSSAEGVGIAFSKENSPFIPLPWLDPNICSGKFDNQTGFCTSEKSPSQVNGWIPVYPQSGNAEQFYAQMQPISGVDIKPGKVTGKVMVVITQK